MMNILSRFAKDESGATAIEYGLIAAIVGFTEMFIKKTSPVLFRVLGIYLPLITTNCAVLGIPLLTVQEIGRASCRERV